jgi:hypothetical protein
MEDGFSDPDSGWGTDSYPAFDRGYQDGKYFFGLYESNWMAWTEAGGRLDDVVIDVEAQQASGAGDGHYGVLCRYAGPGEFYYFAVTGDGYYAILRIMDGDPQVLTGRGFVESEYVATGGQINRIRAVCQGDQLSLSINQQQVANVVDDSLRSGSVGLAAGTGPSGSLRVLFDNLVVASPGREGVEE